MASKAGEAIFDRTAMAAEVLADKEWLDAEFCGDFEKATDTVESDCFPELSAFGLSRLLTLLRTFPTKEAWKNRGYNIMRLWAEHEEAEEKKRGDRPRAERKGPIKREEHEVALKKIEELEWTLKQVRESDQAKDAKIEKLVGELNELRGEVKTLNRMLEQKRQHQAV